MKIDAQFDFSAEPRTDLIKYFEVLTKELDRLLEACKDKHESLELLEKFVKAGLKGNGELKKWFPTKDKAEAGIQKIRAELTEHQREFAICEELYKTAMKEVKSRVGSGR